MVSGRSTIAALALVAGAVSISASCSRVAVHPASPCDTSSGEQPTVHSSVLPVLIDISDDLVQPGPLAAAILSRCGVKQAPGAE